MFNVDSDMLTWISLLNDIYARASYLMVVDTWYLLGPSGPPGPTAR